MLRYHVSKLTPISSQIFTPLTYITGNIIQSFNRFLTLVYVLWDPIRQ